MSKEKLSWTYKCKNFIMILLAFIIFSVMGLTAYEIITNNENTAITISLISLVGLIIPILGALLPSLLKHEREKKTKPKKKEKK